MGNFKDMIHCFVNCHVIQIKVPIRAFIVGFFAPVPKWKRKFSPFFAFHALVDV